MSKQHTPGPWTLCSDPINPERFHLPEKWKQVAITGGGAAFVTGLNHEANARLIAAAPDLLEALEMLLASPDLCLENLEPETIEIMNHCNNLIDHLKQ